MLDTLDSFQTITDGDLILKLHPDEVAADAGAGRAAGAARRSPTLEALRRHAARPDADRDVPAHDDFAVRTLGLPGMVGALGACFGKVVTLDSPRARPPGSFNWAATLWHELAHVDDAAAVEPARAALADRRRLGVRGAPRRRQLGARRRVRLPARLRRRRADQAGRAEHRLLDGRTINLAYHQSSLLVEHLVETVRRRRAAEAAAGYGRGEAQEAALQGASA